MSRKILKVRDVNDSYYTKLKDIFDIPMRLLIVGKSQLSGKTNLILNLLLRNEFYRDKYDGENIFIITNNKLDNKLKILRKEKDIPDENVMPFDEDDLEDLYDQLEEEFIDDVADKKKPSNKLIIFDDVAYSGGLKNKTAGVISKIVMNGRHANISSIFTTQKFSLVQTGVRSNVTGAILFNTSQKELELMSDDYNYLENKKEFIKIFRKTTEKKNSFMVVNFTNDKPDMYMDSEFKPIQMN
tara:strand:- start:35 stop:760 length:726 start_codon:yes stop_codon:yes gene_type:complete